MENKDTIQIQPILVKFSDWWKKFIDRYIKTFCITRNSELNLTPLFWHLAHACKQANLIYAVANYLFINKAELAKRPSYSYFMLESVLLNSVYTYRESLKNIINEVFQLRINFDDEKATNSLLKKILTESPAIHAILIEMGPSSQLGKYIDTYRNPYVHEEHLSNISTVEDFAKAIGGIEQPRVFNFIEKSYELSNWLKNMEQRLLKLVEKQVFKD